MLLSFKVELVSEITGSRVFGSIEHNMEHRGQGQYVISYQPTVNSGLVTDHIATQTAPVLCPPCYTILPNTLLPVISDTSST